MISEHLRLLSLISDDNINMEVSSLVARRNKLAEQKWILYEMQLELEEQINEIDDKIMQLCDHNWIYDSSRLEPSGSSNYLCTKCQSSN